VLLGDIVRRPRAWLLAHGEAALEADQSMQWMQALERLESGEPLPYVLGWWEFFGRRFMLTPQVLIPRPETEYLVDAALAWLAGQPKGQQVLDLGTGSGCIAVSLALEGEGLRIVASDRHLEALKVAQQNLRYYDLQDQIALLQADLLTPLVGRFELICANLPYIPSATLAELPVGQREPLSALDGGRDGLDFIRKTMGSLPRHLVEGGLALFEIEAGQGELASRVARQLLPAADVNLRQDLAGRDRLLMVML
jgi:release factor glutamine methyltransferase